MPANLTPQYHQAEERYKAATTPADKVTALEEMLRQIPKHKGTEKMQAGLKRRLSKLRDQAQQKTEGSQRPLHHVDREGAGRIALAGPANAGKSYLLSRLTRAQPEVAAYPFTTRTPQPGMMVYEDIQIQLVDLPPLTPEVLEAWQLALIEQSDAVLLLFNVNDSQLLEQSQFVLETLAGRGLQFTEDAHPPLLVLGNRVESDKDQDNFSAWLELLGDQLPAHPFTSQDEGRLRWLRQRLFEMLRIVRVYTKVPGRKRDFREPPYVLKQGSTVVDLARQVHRDLATRFQFARLWSATADGLRVEHDHELEDGDLIEIRE